MTDNRYVNATAILLGSFLLSGDIGLGAQETLRSADSGVLHPPHVLSGRSPALIVTIDGLSFVNTLLGPSGFPPIEGPSNYLEPALESLGLPVPDDHIIPFPWSGDAGDTNDVIPPLRTFLREQYNAAQNENAQFIVVAHSWGTFLTYIALSRESSWPDPIYCDLYITLGSPLGTCYAHDGYYPEESVVSGYVAFWLWRLDFDECTNCYPSVQRCVNYWAWGDVISGPLGSFAPFAENEKVDPFSETDGHAYRNIGSTYVWHWYDSLKPDGPSDNQPLLDEVEALIQETLAGPPDTTPPSVVSHTYSDGPGTNIKVVFSEDMDAGTFTSSSVLVEGAASGTHACTFSFDHASLELIVNPDVDFAYDELATVTVGTAVEDLAGNNLLNPYGFSFTIGSSPNVPPAIQILEPLDAEEYADQFYQIRWIDSDPDDNAYIHLFYDTDDNFDGNEHWIIGQLHEDAEGWSGDSYFWPTSIAAAGTYYVMAIIDDRVNPPVVRHSAGTVAIAHPPECSNFSVESAIAVDDPGDGDGIVEGGEPAEYTITLCNDSGSTFYCVRGDLTTSTPGVTITDSRVVYGEIDSGECSAGPERFDFITEPWFDGSAEFSLHLQYDADPECSQTICFENKSLSVTVCQEGTCEVSLSAGTVTIDDACADCNGDGNLQSGERAGFYVQIHNTGSATAIDPRGTIQSLTYCDGSSVLADDQANYPNIPAGASATNPQDFDFYQAPHHCAEALDMTMDVCLGADHTECQPVNFTVNVLPAPYISLSPETYDFGVVCDNEIAVLASIYNYGSAPLQISSVVASHPSDTTIVGAPTTVAPGATTPFTILVQTIGLPAGYITTTITVNSNAHVNPVRAVTITGTVFCGGATSGYAPLWQLDRPQYGGRGHDFNNLVIGDTDNDAHDEIVVTTEPTVFSSVFHPGRVQIYEQVDNDDFQLKWEDGDLDGLNNQDDSLALRDFDGDGYLDIVAICSNGSSTLDFPWKAQWFEATANDVWVSRGVAFTQSASQLLSMTTGDSDNDGAQEILVSRRGLPTVDPKVFVYEYSGGSFSNTWTSPPIMNQDDDDTVGGAMGLTVADSDGDGNGEIIFATDEAQIYIYERIGNNSFVERLRYQNWDYLSTNWGDPLAIAVADTDGDGAMEIIYTSSEGYLFLLEATGDNSWNESAPEHYALVADGLCLAVGNADDEGEPKIVVGLDGGGTTPCLDVFATIADDSHTSVWQSTATEIPDLVIASALLNVNASPWMEILASVVDLGIVVLTKQSATDLQIVPNNISFEPGAAEENDSVAIRAIVQNVGSDAATDVVVRFYEGDPDSGGTQIGVDALIAVLPGEEESEVVETWIPVLEGDYLLCVLADPEDGVSEADEGNNKGCKSIQVADDDIEPPVISDVTVEEHNGDGDGLIEDDEEALISWTAADASGIGGSACTIDEMEYPAEGSFYVVAGPFIAGEHCFTIEATDADNSPETSQSDPGTFWVYISAPVVVSTQPENTEDDVSLAPTIEACFNEPLDPTTVSPSTVGMDDMGGNPVAGGVVYDSAERRILFTPDGDLQNWHTYTMRLSGPPGGIRDENGNEIEAAYVWSFLTEADTLAPVATISSPLTGETVSGLTSVLGTAWDVNFEHYEVSLGEGCAPDAWSVVCEASTPVLDGGVCEWWTGGVADGDYTLKLAVTDAALPDRHVSEATTCVSVDNAIVVVLDLDGTWTYQSLPGQSNCGIVVTVEIIDDPLENSSYTYSWEFVLPPDVSEPPITLQGGGAEDTLWEFAARSCDVNSLSDSGTPHQISVTVTGDDYGNSWSGESDFGICLLGDVNNDTVVDVADRAIVNAFWKTGSAGSFTLKDCDVNCDGVVDVADRAIVNAVWKGQLCENSVSEPCPLR